MQAVFRPSEEAGSKVHEGLHSDGVRSGYVVFRSGIAELRNSEQESENAKCSIKSKLKKKLIKINSKTYLIFLHFFVYKKD